MDKASRAALAQILGPLAEDHLRPAEDDDPSPAPSSLTVFAVSAYQQAIASRNFVAGFAMREQLKALETETLLILAVSHATLRRAQAVRPLFSHPAREVRRDVARKSARAEPPGLP